MASTQNTRTVAVVQQKGGVGKTTSTFHLGRAAVVAGYRTLVVDLDSQGNATDALTSGDIDPNATMADVLGDDLSLPDVVVPSVWPGLDVAPATSALAAAIDYLGTVTAGREHRLRKALEKIEGQYDLVLVDTPPTLGLSVVNALTAAHAAVIVAEPHAWSADGIADVSVTIRDVVEYLNPRLHVAGVLVNRVRQTKTAGELIDELATGIGSHLPGVPVWVDRTVPLWTDIADYVDAGVGLDQGSPRLRQLTERVYTPIVADLIGGASE